MLARHQNNRQSVEVLSHDLRIGRNSNTDPNLITELKWLNSTGQHNITIQMDTYRESTTTAIPARISSFTNQLIKGKISRFNPVEAAIRRGTQIL